MEFLSALFGKGVPTISAKELQQRLSSHESLMVLDVREPEEYEAGHIDGAVLIPLGDLSQRTHALPQDRPIVCVCASGSRSLSATRWLISAGLDAINLGHGMFEWQLARLPTVLGNGKGPQE